MSLPPVESNNTVLSNFFLKTYVCTEPAGDVPLLSQNGPDEYTAQLRTLQRSAEHFSDLGYDRTVERLRFEQAKLHMKYGNYQQATSILQPLWQSISWRTAGWWKLLLQLDLALKTCAEELGRGDVLAQVQWELQHLLLASISHPLSGPTESHALSLKSDLAAPPNVLSCVIASFDFDNSAAHIGLPLRGCIQIQSHAHLASMPIVISQIELSFDAILPKIRISNQEPENPKSDRIHDSTRVITLHSSASQLSPEELERTAVNDDVVLYGETDISIGPGKSRLFSLEVVPRMTGSVSLRSINMSIFWAGAKMLLASSSAPQNSFSSLLTPHAPKRDTIVIHPKPAKLRIEVRGLKPEYYIGETVVLDVILKNDEDHHADVTLRLAHLGEPDISVLASGGPLSEIDTNIYESVGASLPKHAGRLVPASSHVWRLQFCSLAKAGIYTTSMVADYRLSSDPETPISTLAAINFTAREPFTATHSFSSRVHPSPWPSYFRMSEDGQEETGIVQRWAITSQLTNQTPTAITIKSIFPQSTKGATAKVTIPPADSPSPSGLEASDSNVYDFWFDIQKLDLEDRTPLKAELQMKVIWTRAGDAETSITTYLAIPEILLPFGEPRVLLSTQHPTSVSTAICLRYTIENPSMYTLSFDVSMDTSDDFAFSGPKKQMLQLVPLSRHTIEYIVLPLVRKLLISPQLRVYDTQFHKLLKVQAASKGLRDDTKGISIRIDAPS